MNTTYTAEGHIDAHPQVVLSVAHGPGGAIATLQGDLDVATAPALREGLLALLRPGLRLLVLDLSRLWFCDAAGVSVLLGTRRRATLLHIPLRLAAPRSRVAKILEVTGADCGFMIYSTLPEALALPLPPTLGPDRHRALCAG
ncbi:anti-sigma B factor antagonist [Thermomonospora echinospora]|uniref:Anti-sigma factor antagonist n=1 Tax=Thermomonospora echinospora TaxID=1992 RepID=A0A1H5YKS9_9ACTN|nr:STAS domain-containing protein [Thermomonospora echinospora]SEG24759.1 anti-sigma B factor antagonist [Thermomonospora echinospora]